VLAKCNTGDDSCERSDQKSRRGRSPTFQEQFLLLSRSFDDMLQRGIKCCWTVKQYHNGMLVGFDKKPKLKQARVRRKLIAMIWKGKWDVNILTNKHRPPTTFVIDTGKLRNSSLFKSITDEQATMAKGDQTANSYSISQRMWTLVTLVQICGNECMEASSSIHPKRKTKHTG
jgi:hypothetical protein